jgi:vacuolar-type H+-ATPase subunit F/Vma7
VKVPVRVVARPAVAAGFGLAGLAALEVDATGTASPDARLVQLVADPAAGVLLVEQALWDALPEATRSGAAARPLPLVVPFPSPSWAPPEEAALGYVAELLRQAIGYRVRLRLAP